MARPDPAVFILGERRAAWQPEIFDRGRMMSPDVFSASGQPFDNTPDSRFFYANSTTEAIYSSLLSEVCERRGLMLLVGESGTGKTTLLLKLKEALEWANCLVLFPRSAKTSFDELLKACCDEVGIAEDVSDRLGRVRALANVMVGRLDAGTTAAILVDDAHELTDDALEDLSWLTDLEKGEQRLVQIVLAGQPDLVPRLCGSKLLFVQDSAITYSGLQPLDPQEVEFYIQHRLQAAGYQGPDLFPPEAIERIAHYAEGVPCLINQICAMTLHLVDGPMEGTISAEMVEAAVQELASGAQPAQLADALGERPLPDDDFGDQVATSALEPAGGQSDHHVATIETTDEARQAGPDVSVDIPEPPHPDDESAEAREGALVATRETGRTALDRPPLAGEPRSKPAVAPFPKNLVVPAADTRPARRYVEFMPIAALFLAGLIMGGLGMLFYRVWPGSPTENSSNGMLLSDAEDVQLKALSQDTAVDVVPAPEPHSLVETTAAQQYPPKAPKVQPLAARVPTLDVAQVSGSEDEAIPLDIHAALAASDGTEALTIAISGLPEGAWPSAGRDHGDGRWSLSPDELTGLTLRPPQDFSGRFQLTVEATARRAEGENASASDPLVVEVAGTADVPSLEVAAATGGEDKAIPLDIRAALADTDGSESLSVTISNLPDGARPSAGHDNGDGSWSLSPDELAGLTLTPPAEFSGRFQLTVEATAREADGDSVSTTAPLEVTVTAAPAPFVAAKGDFVIQLAALRSATEAVREAERLENRFRDLLGDAPLKIYKADVNGVPYYRVRTEPVSVKAEAFQMCSQLKSNQQDCMVLQHVAEMKPIAGQEPEQPPGTAPISLLPREMTTALAELSTPKSGTGLTVRDLFMTRDVVDREPTGMTKTFSPQDGRAIAYARINNSGPPTQVTFIWLYDDALYVTVDMEIGTSYRWRTWSSAEVWLGEWRVQIVSPDGEILAENAFTVE